MVERNHVLTGSLNGSRAEEKMREKCEQQTPGQSPASQQLWSKSEVRYTEVRKGESSEAKGIWE